MLEKCPFSSLQAAGLCQCGLAQQVVRRGGSEYDCSNNEAQTVCSALARRLIEIGFAELGRDDDLAVTPKSVYDRVWMGGLLALQQLTEGLQERQELNDVWSLVARARPELSRLAEHKAILLRAIEDYRAPKRRQRRS